MIFLKLLFVSFGLLAETVQFKADNDAFLFTLVGPDETGPQKISLNPGVNGGIHCARNWGPSFGLEFRIETGDGHCDLHFWGEAKYFVGQFKLGGAFERPSNMDRWSSIFGGDTFYFNELEVFQVKF